MIDLTHVIERGIEQRDREDALSFYGWAMNHLRFMQDMGEWDEDALHASDLAVMLEGDDGKCERNLWLRTHGAEKQEQHLGEKMMFDHGHQIQLRFTWYIQMGLPEGWEIREIEEWLTPHLPDDLRGSADLTLEDPDGNVVVLDFKTKRGHAFEHLDEPKASNVLQVQTYMEGLKNKLEDNGSGANVRGCLLYLSREGQDLPKQFQVHEDPQRVAATHQYAKEQINGSKPDLLTTDLKVSRNKTTDDSLYLDIPWQCSYCPFRGVSCDGAISEDAEYGNKVGQVNGEGPEVTIDEDDVAPNALNEIEELIQDAYSENRVTEK